MPETVDLSRWIAQYPLHRLRSESRRFVEIRRREMPGEYGEPGAVERHVRLLVEESSRILGPFDLATREQLRAELEQEYDFGAGIPVDVFIWGRGEPKNPRATKLGGHPYLPKDRPWPQDGSFRPMTFAGQLNFEDSRDHVGELPGDLLLIFCSVERTAQPGALHFEWVTGSVETWPSLPEARPRFEPCYGARYRAMEYPDPEEWSDEVNPCNAWIFEANKIGGTPYEFHHDLGATGRFLGSVAGWGWGCSPQPFLNRSEPIDEEEGLLDRLFRWGSDMAILNLFLEPDGSVAWDSQGR